MQTTPRKTFSGLLWIAMSQKMLNGLLWRQFSILLCPRKGLKVCPPGDNVRSSLYTMPPKSIRETPHATDMLSRSISRILADSSSLLGTFFNSAGFCHCMCKGRSYRAKFFKVSFFFSKKNRESRKHFQSSEI